MRLIIVRFSMMMVCMILLALVASPANIEPVSGKDVTQLSYETEPIQKNSEHTLTLIPHPEEGGSVSSELVQLFPGDLMWQLYAVPDGFNPYIYNVEQFDNLINSSTEISNGTIEIESYNTGLPHVPNILNWQSASELNDLIGANVEDLFALVVSGYFIPKETGTYRFSISGDDTVDLFIDDINVANNYFHLSNGEIELNAGQIYQFRVRHVEWWGEEFLHLFWRKPSQLISSVWFQDADELFAINPFSDKSHQQSEQKNHYTASYQAGELVGVLALPTDGWAFREWVCPDTDLYSSDSLFLFIMPEQDVGLTAFMGNNLLSLQLNPPEAGQVRGAGHYAEGEIAEIEAIGGSAWVFENWTNLDGEEVSDEPVVNYEVQQGDQTLQANFVSLFPGGTGTQQDPYHVETLEQLAAIATDPYCLNKHFIQVADIDASETAHWNNGKGWLPIGTDLYRFTGTYDGQGYEINGLIIYRPNENNIGLFGVSSHSTIKNVGLTNVHVTGHSYVGGLAGIIANGQVLSSHATGTINGENHTGGLAGEFRDYGGHMMQSFFSGIVSGESIRIGGLLGRLGHSALLTNSYAHGSVSGGCCVGGLVGNNHYSKIENSYATVVVEINGESTLFGGLVGQSFLGEVYDSFWDVDVSGQTTSFGGIGMPTQEMKTHALYFGTGWDFLNEETNGSDNIWGIDETGEDNDGYPFLAWQGLSHEILSPIVQIHPPHATGTTFLDFDLEILSLGPETPVAFGVCWNTTGNPDLDDSLLVIDPIPGEGTIGVGITELNAATTYFFRVFIETDDSVWYSHEVSFSTYPVDPLTPAGFGTPHSPFQIANMNHLYWMSITPNHWDKHFIQVSHIDASETASWYGGKGWMPIGDYISPFTGTYNGQGYTINGLHINRPEDDFIGLFGFTLYATVSNLGVTSVNITGNNDVGGLVGVNNEGVYDSCFATGQVQGSRRVGGLAGQIVVNAHMTRSFFTGSVTGGWKAGGLIGFLSHFSFLSNSYARGAVNGEHGVGGLVGEKDISEVYNSYAAATVTGMFNTGGLIGYGGENVHNSFWDMEVSGHFSGEGGTGKTTAEMQEIATFTSLATEGLDEPWDFAGNPFDDTGQENIWQLYSLFNDGYPFLSWQLEGLYLLQLVSDPENTGALFSGSGYYFSDTEATISVEEPEGYVFQYWTADSGIAGLIADPLSKETSFTMPEQDVTLTAFFLPIYNVSADINPEGGGSVTGEGAYTQGETAQLEAAAATGYHFVNWQENDVQVSQSNPYSFVVDRDYSLVAHFALNTYTITGQPENSEMGTVDGSGVYAHFTEVTLSAMPNTGYHFVEWTEGGEQVSDQADYTFIVDSDRTLVAHFAINVYTINAQPNDPTMGTVSGSGNYDHGEPVTLTATPGNNRQFIDWTVDGQQVSTNPIYQFNATENLEIVANFQWNIYQINASSTTGGHLDPEGVVNVFHGHNQTFTVNPDPGHFNTDVIIDDISLGPRTSYTFVNVTNHHTIHADFGIHTYTITASSGENGTIDPPGATIVEYGTNLTVTITPSPGFFVYELIVDGQPVEPTQEYTFEQIAQDHTIHAEFAQPAIFASATPGGTIDPEGTIAVPYGSSQNFQITPLPGHYIADVIVDDISMGVITSYLFLNVTSFHTIHAEFNIFTYTVTAIAGDNGEINPSGDIEVDHGSDLSFTITPDPGFYLSELIVDGEAVEPLPEYTFENITQNHVIEASFSQHTIVATASEGGIIQPEGTITVPHGDDQHFQFFPDDGHYIQDVMVDGNSIGAVESYLFENVSDDHAIHVEFAIHTYTITASAGANGEIDPSGEITVDHGSELVFSITPSPGFFVSELTVDGQPVEPTQEFTFSDISQNHSIHAEFAQPAIFASSTSGGNIDPEGTVHIPYGGSQHFQFSPDEGHYIQEVYVDGNGIGPVESYEFVNVVEDHTLHVAFSIFTYTLTYSAGEHGSLVGDTEQVVEHGSDGTPVEAIPDVGHHFTQWSDGLTENPRTETNVNNSMEVEAAFAISSYNLTIQVDPPGSGEAFGGGTYQYLSEVSLEAVPHDTYEFVHWADQDGAIVSSQEAFTYTIPAHDVILTAHFTPITYVVSFLIDIEFGEPVIDATVTLGDETNPPGIYEFDDILPGQYSFLVMAEDFMDVSGDIEILDQDKIVFIAMYPHDTSTMSASVKVLKVYPNPATRIIRLELENTGQTTLHVALVNQQGRSVISKSTDSRGRQELELGVEDLTPGTYMLIIKNHETIIFEKIIIQ